ncbi:MAG: hypothetical protein M3Z04_07580 [Chloroflexota bacterium]|nr:hypothetical protein [Chloroflexota bacterium]
MNTVTELHRKAMALVDQGFAARRLGNAAAARDLLRCALELEAAAAQMLEADFAAEPSRSVLYRSAATLAIDCLELHQAEQLISAGLAGHPPTAIANELRELLQQIQAKASKLSGTA